MCVTKFPLPLFSSQFLLSILGRKKKRYFKGKDILLKPEVSRSPMMGSRMERERRPLGYAEEAAVSALVQLLEVRREIRVWMCN